MAVYMAVLQPGDTILSLELSHGGHLTHGLKVNFSGRLYTIAHYGVSRETNMVDYDEVLALAKQYRPKLIICGASAYSRDWDYKALREAADELALLVDAVRRQLRPGRQAEAEQRALGVAITRDGQSGWKYGPVR